MVAKPAHPIDIQARYGRSIVALRSDGARLSNDETLRAYSDIDPDLRVELIKELVLQGTHRRELESMVVKGLEQRQNRGQLIACIVAVVGLGLSALVGIRGNTFVASVLAVVSVGGSTAASVLARMHIFGTNNANPPL